MGTPVWVIPVAVLGAICVVGFLFVWWWFPHTWKKGTKMEMDLRHAEDAERPEEAAQQRTWAKSVVAKALAAERGEDVSNYHVAARPGGNENAPPAYGV